MLGGSFGSAAKGTGLKALEFALSICDTVNMYDFVVASCAIILYLFLVRFNENIITDPGFVDLFPASRFPKQLHHLVKPIYRSTPSASRESLNSRGANMKEKGFRILTEPSNLSSVLQWASDSEVALLALFFDYFYFYFLMKLFISTLAKPGLCNSMN
mgnify:CR=1 FL=1